MFRRPRAKDILTHIFFFSLFLIVPTLAFVRPPGESYFALTRVFVQDTIANCVLLCFFYLNYYILIPQFFFNQKYMQYILWAIMFLSLALAIPHLAGRNLPGISHDLPPIAMQDPKDVFPHPPGSPSLGTFVFDEFRRHLYLFFTAIFFSFLFYLK